MNQGRRPGFREIAREEFWIVAKTFFAPIYLAYLLWSARSKSPQAQDQIQTDLVAVADPTLTPAE